MKNFLWLLCFCLLMSTSRSGGGQETLAQRQRLIRGLRTASVPLTRYYDTSRIRHTTETTDPKDEFMNKLYTDWRRTRTDEENKTINKAPTITVDRSETTFDPSKAEYLLYHYSRGRRWSTSMCAIHQGTVNEIPIQHSLFQQMNIKILHEKGKYVGKVVEFLYVLKPYPIPPIVIPILKCGCEIIKTPIAKFSGECISVQNDDELKKEKHTETNYELQQKNLRQYDNDKLPKEVEAPKVDSATIEAAIQQAKIHTSYPNILACIPRNEICHNGEWIYLSRGVYGSNSYFVFTEGSDGKKVNVIAHLLL